MKTLCNMLNSLLMKVDLYSSFAGCSEIRIIYKILTHARLFILVMFPSFVGEFMITDKKKKNLKSYIGHLQINTAISERLIFLDSSRKTCILKHRLCRPIFYYHSGCVISKVLCKLSSSPFCLAVITLADKLNRWTWFSTSEKVYQQQEHVDCQLDKAYPWVTEESLIQDRKSKLISKNFNRALFKLVWGTQEQRTRVCNEFGG